MIEQQNRRFHTLYTLGFIFLFTNLFSCSKPFPKPSSIQETSDKQVINPDLVQTFPPAESNALKPKASSKKTKSGKASSEKSTTSEGSIYPYKSSEQKETVEEEAAESLIATFEVKPASLPASLPAIPKGAKPGKGDVAFLKARNLLIPVKGITKEQLKDTYRAPRSGGRRHNAIDILAPKGTPIFAANSGTILKIYTNRLGGLTIYQRDAKGPYVYYYAHLSGYKKGLKEGQKVKRGDILGYVGTTGNAKGRHPHLHFAITKVLNAKKWYSGASINPYPLLAKPKK